MVRSRTTAGFSSLTDALRPPRLDRLPPPAPGRQAAQRASVSRSAGMPANPPDRGPGAVQPGADGAFALDCRQVTGQENPSLPVPLTGLALAHRPGQVKPRGLAAAEGAGVLRFPW
jgi:hypothetical protein